MRIKQLGDPILRQTSVKVNPEKIQSTEVQELLGRMRDTLNGIKAISDENGNALSAPQMGHLLRIVLLRINGEFVPMINPEYTALDNSTFAFEEECFSMYQLRGTVERFERVDVHYLNENGDTQQLELAGELAGLIQHEVDHLNGVLFIDHLQGANTPRSIDYELRDQPVRLAQVKQLHDFMAGNDA